MWTTSLTNKYQNLQKYNYLIIKILQKLCFQKIKMISTRKPLKVCLEIWCFQKEYVLLQHTKKY